MSELIVLPRAEVEELLERLDDEIWRSTPDEQTGINYARREIDALLAAAKPVVDEAVTHAVTFSSRPDAQRFVETQALWEVPARGTYRMLLIAADAAEEG